MRLVRYARRGLAIRSLSTKGPLVDLAVDNEGIATLTMQRPPVNSLSLELLQEFNKALDEVEKSKAKGLIITSALATVFSAGLDITELYNPNVERLSEFWTSVQGFWMKIFSAPYPTAAAINGHAPAGGCLIAISSEYRTMMSGQYIIGLNEVALGIAVPQWLTDNMRTVISQREAELALNTGRLYTVEEALKVGLIDETASDKADAIEKSKRFIRKFDNITPIAHNLTKQRIRADIIKSFLLNREADLNEFKHVCLKPQTQKVIGMYLQKLKTKSDK